MEVGKEIPNLIRKHTQKSGKGGGGGFGFLSFFLGFSFLLGYQILHKFQSAKKGTRTLKVEKRMFEN
jgi:hypothetical protein